MAAHHPHDAENHRQDRLPGREHHGQGDEQQRALVVIVTQDVVRADIHAIEESADRSPHEQADGKIVGAGAQQRRGDPRDRRGVAVGPVGCGIAPAVQHHDAVDRDLDTVGEARQEHRPGAPRLLVLPVELAGEDGRVIRGRTRRGEARQRDRARQAAFAQVERAHLVGRRWFGQWLPQGDDAEDDDQGLQQDILHECGWPPPPVSPIGGQHRFCRGVGHSLIRPCWTASNTASPPVWTSSLR